MSKSGDIRDTDDSEPWTRLLARAGRRPEPPAETREAAYFSALVVWQDAVRRRRRARFGWIALAAAATVVVAGLAWLSAGLPRTAPTLAASAVDGSGAHIVVGESFEVVTRPGVSLRTAGGHGLRVAAGSQLRFETVHHMTLESGQIYFETAAPGSAAAFRIETRFGEVRHVGTRYSVEVGRERMWVRVRDGQVGVRTAVSATVAAAGTAVAFDRQGHETARQRIESFGQPWLWADSLAPPTRLDGRQLYDVLAEIAFQSGRNLQFADDAIRDACRGIVLNGPLLELAVGDRLFAVLVTTGLEAIEDGDRILIRRRSTPEEVLETTATP